MKFGRLLRDTAQDLPELGSLFAMYKRLKKLVKRMDNNSSSTNASGEEDRFVEAITDSIQELNDDFLEREENAIISMEQLDACAHSQQQSLADTQSVLRTLVNLHGEMLLLLHWSILAYSALVKILKKHYKRTGLRVQSPLLQDMMSQPFCSTEVVAGLVQQAEALIQTLTQRISEQPAYAHAAHGSSHHPSSAQLSSSTLSAGLPVVPSPTPQGSGHHPHASRHAAIHTLSAHMPRIADYMQHDSSNDGGADMDVDSGDEATSCVPTSAGQATAIRQPHQGGMRAAAGAAGPSCTPSTSTPSYDSPSAASGHQHQHQPNLQYLSPHQASAPTIMRQTQVALATWTNLVSTASTPSTILPAPNYSPAQQAPLVQTSADSTTTSTSSLPPQPAAACAM